MPIGWPKPFGLVVIEAMACRTPVIAFPSIPWRLRGASQGAGIVLGRRGAARLNAHRARASRERTAATRTPAGNAVPEKPLFGCKMHLAVEPGRGAASDPRPSHVWGKITARANAQLGRRERSSAGHTRAQSRARLKSQRDVCVAPLGQTRPNRPRRNHELDITHHPLWRARSSSRHNRVS
jgi:hypothetical protein